MMPAESRLYFAVGLGSGLGAASRYLISAGSVAIMGPTYPWGTLLVNLLGSFAIGLYASLTAPKGYLQVSPVKRQFVLTGFCGGFTTFSMFSLEALQLVEQSAFTQAGFYILASAALWLLSVWLGFHLGERINLNNA